MKILASKSPFMSGNEKFTYNLVNFGHYGVIIIKWTMDNTLELVPIRHTKTNEMRYPARTGEYNCQQGHHNLKIRNYCFSDFKFVILIKFVLDIDLD